MTRALRREPGYLYFVDAEGNVKRAPRARGREKVVELVADACCAPEPGHRYYVDDDGDVSRGRLA